MKLLRDPAIAIAQAFGGGTRKALDSSTSTAPAIGGMAQAMEIAQQDAARRGLRDAGSIGRAMAWCRENHLHRLLSDQPALTAIARLLDRNEV